MNISKLSITVLMVLMVTLVGCGKKAEPAPVEEAPVPVNEQVVEEADEMAVEEAEQEDSAEPIDEPAQLPGEQQTEESSSETQEEAAAEEAYVVNTEKSVLKWRAQKVTSSQHYGDIKIKSGELMMTGDALTAGSFVIDMKTIAVGDLTGGSAESLQGHLSGDDFFAVATYPEAKIVLKNATQVTSGEYKITADLTIKDQTNEVMFTATKTAANDMITLTADFEIDRTRWGIKYGSGKFFKGLGDRAIKDQIGYTLTLVVDKK